MRAGIDSYSYHRLLGELRRGEEPPSVTWADGVGDVVCEVRRLGVRVLSLETCFVGRAADLTPERLSAAAGLELIPAWGAPEGIRYGEDREALADLLGWIELAAAAGCTTMRIVIGGPRLRELEELADRFLGSVPSLAVACRAARAAGLRLAIENHGDLESGQLLEVLARVDAPDVLGVCFDTANALRVGEDVVQAAAAFAPHLDLVHLKDIEPVARQIDHVSGPCSVAYGTGIVPLEETLDVLRQAGFDGPVCVELGQIAPGDDEIALVELCLAWLCRRLP
jgi:sugar phosphate isomerase/epimerase